MKTKRISKLKMAYLTSNGFTDFFFHFGYQGLVIPIFFRKLLAKTKIHKNWLSGFYGGGILSVLERHQDNSKTINY
jgi:hypothetical protein